MIPAEQCCPPAPAATTRDSTLALDDKIGSVLDELRIHAHDVERRVDSRRVQNRTDECSYRYVHQRSELGQFGRRRETMREVCRLYQQLKAYARRIVLILPKRRDTSKSKGLIERYRRRLIVAGLQTQPLVSQTSRFGGEMRQHGIPYSISPVF